MIKKTLPNGAAPPQPEAEPPHQMLARLMGDKERLIREIRERRSAWGERNLVAQRKRQCVASVEMTAFREHHASLSEQLAAIDRQIGDLNRAVRQQRADVQARRANGAGDRQKAETPKKAGPLNSIRIGSFILN
jgi:hypothetical protein